MADAVEQSQDSLQAYEALKRDIHRHNVAYYTEDSPLIPDAEYDRLLDVLILTTDIDEGSMNALVGANWSIRPRFFTVATTGLRDGLPPSAKVNVQFQASDDPDSGTISPSPTTWTSDMSQLDGLRFLRYRVIFDIDATGAGISPSNPRPELDYIKLPFKW